MSVMLDAKNYEQLLSNLGKRIDKAEGREMEELREEAENDKSCQDFLGKMTDPELLQNLCDVLETLGANLKWGTDHVRGFGLGSDYGRIACEAMETRSSIERLLEDLEDLDELETEIEYED